jgi:methyl-accepting chemotaxis protein
MFKNLKLGIKMFAGFILVLILLCGIAVVGYLGMTGLLERASMSMEMNRLESLILETRRQEKNFIIRKDEQSVNRNVETTATIRQLAADVKGKVDLDTLKSQMDRIVAEVDGYAASFDHYVQLHKKNTDALDEMNKKAALVLGLCVAIREKQKHNMMAVVEQSVEDIKNRLANANDAGRLRMWLLEIKPLQMAIMGFSDARAFDGWSELSDKFHSLANNLAGRLKDEEEAILAKAILDEYTVYSDNFLKLREHMTDWDATKAINESFPKIVEAVETLQNSLSERLVHVQENQAAVISNGLAMAEHANAIIRLFLDVRLAEKSFIMSGVDSAWSDDVAGGIEKIRSEAQELKKLLKESQDIKLLESVIEAVNGYQDQFAIYVAQTKEQYETEKLMVKSAQTVQQICEAARVEQNRSMVSRMESSIRWMAIATVLALIIGLAAAWAITRSLTKPFRRLVRLARTIRDGDLSRRLHMKQRDEMGQLAEALDEMADSLEAKADLALKIADGDLSQDVVLVSEKDVLGKALKTMVDNLNEVLGQVEQSVSQVAAGSNQVSDSSQSLSQGATQQAASLEEITSSLTELGSQTKSNAENASLANNLSGDARQKAKKGNEQMRDMVASMADINQSSHEIAKIIKTIDEIAFQTNLLALNAAVEAARAGKHGKGFAVVAQEVRSLAGRSAEAARETAEMIEGSVKNIEKGTAMVDRTADALRDIVEGAAKVSDLVGEIAAASNEQAQGLSQINSGLLQVDQVTHQNTANSEQTASAAAELSSQAQTLLELVDRFKLKHASTAHAADVPKEQDVWEECREPERLPQPGRKKIGNSRPDVPAVRDQAVDPEDVINLDDKDFGKY